MTATVRVTDYDSIASAYDRRYAREKYRGIEKTLLDFVADSAPPPILEVGAGTGHWLAFLRGRGHAITGLDPSANMLARARGTAPDVPLLRARAEALPCAAGSFGRIFAVNVLHHLSDRERFFAEARRVLGGCGAVMTIGLDPHAGGDRWWVYDYFPETIGLDRERYPAASRIRAELIAAGFERAETHVAQVLSKTLTAGEVIGRGLLERSATSQLAILSEEEYRRGRDRLEAAASVSRLETDLRLYATVGR